MSADRNLLFGILALQLDFLTREELIAGMQAWVLVKQRPLADLLVEQGVLTPSRRLLLEPLVAEHIRQHAGDPAQSLAAISSVGALKVELTRIPDEQLAASIPHLADGDGQDSRHQDSDATVSVGQVSSYGARFRVLRPHAQGGLGRIFVARDQELNREVALKEIQPRCADDQAARSRFILEAEVTGALEHPGIVPVYGLGAYADGRPFYAMRFIKGDSLRNAIDRFHTVADGKQQSPFTDPARQLELRQFLGRFIDVCQAVGYAHSRGVLHRDLKPGNIMLGKYGETLVVDWGLAKTKEMPQPPPALASEAAFIPASGSSVEQTQMGMMVGTLHYMSPEQAQGRLDLLGPATDIFSLGATLYHLLTGQPPYHGSAREELEPAVREGRFPPPRQIQREVPPALEAICLKAMAREPDQRYGSTEELISDIEHYLGDEPVTALAEPVVARARRWFRKRPALTATLAVSLVLGLAALGVGSLLVGRKNQELAKTNTQLKTARDKARRNEADAIAQKNRADKNAGEAQRETTRANEQSRLAREREQDARWSAYVPAMNLAFGAWQDGYVGRAQRSLDEQIPTPGQPDLRGPEWYLLWRQCHQEEATLRGHRKRVTAVEYSPDGQTLASASDDGTVNLWNVTDRTIRKQLTGHNAPVKALAFSPTEPWLASSGNDGRIRFWDTRTWEPIRELATGLSSPADLMPLSLAVSPDGKTLVAAGFGIVQYGGGAMFRIWETTTWRELWRKDAGHSGIAISPDSQVLAVSDHGVKTRLYDIHDGRELAVYSDYSFAVGFSPDGAKVFTSQHGYGEFYDRVTGAHFAVPATNANYRRDLAVARDAPAVILVGGTAEFGIVELWDTRRRAFVRGFSGHQGTVWSVSIAPDQSQFATGGEDGTVRVWDGAWLASIQAQGHTGSVLAAALSPDGTLAATGCTENLVCLWNAHSGELLRRLPQPERMFGLAFSPDGKWLAIASSSPYGDGLRLFSTVSQREEVVPLGALEALSVAYSPDNTRLACGARTGQVILLDAATRSVLKTSQPHLTPVYALGWSRDGQRLATGSSDNASRVLDGNSLEVVQTLKGHTGAIRSVSFSAENRRLATASIDGSVKVWDLQSGALAATLARQPLPAYSYSYGVAFTSDGQSLVGVFTNDQYDSELRIYDAKELVEKGKVPFASARATGLGISRDGQRALTGLADGRAVLSGLESSAASLTLGQRPDCYSCDFSPDGSKVAIGGYQTVSVLDVATRRALFSRKAGTEPITSVAFVDNGQKVLTLECEKSRRVRQPGVIRIWDASTGIEFASHPTSNQYGLSAVSRDGGRLALAGLAHQGAGAAAIEIWDTAAWKPVHTMPRLKSGNGCIAFSPDGQTLAIGGAYYFSDQPCSIWLFAVGASTPYAELRGHTSSVTGLVFLEGGKKLVSGGNDQCLRVWDGHTGQMQRRLEITQAAARSAGGAQVTGVAATPRGDRIAVACDNGSCRILETKTWQEVASFVVPDSTLSGVAISPDGMTLVVTSNKLDSRRPGYEFFEIAAPDQVVAYRNADAQFAKADRDKSHERAVAARTRLQALDEAHTRGEASAQDYFLANRLLRTDPDELDPTDRESLALIVAAGDGSLPWKDLPERLKQVEPADKRLAREGQAADKGRNAQRTQQIADLLSEAMANDSPDKAPQALDALARLLRFNPAHAEARQLKDKIEAYRPLRTITNSLDMKLIELRPARFWMGSPLDEEGRQADEVLHPVRLTKACYLGAYEVTRGQFARFVEEASHVTEAERLAADKPESPTWRKPGFDQEDDHPVIMVSWTDARAFCDWLSKKEGRKYRLPTEAEWELACRAGTITAYVWGTRADEGEGWGNLAGQELKGQPNRTTLFPWSDGTLNTSPVGKFKPNSWGLFDLAGNVSEWCQDQYQSYPLAIEDDPLGGTVGTPPVARGSSWSSEPNFSRSAFRRRVPAATTAPHLGFRVVLEEN